MTSDYQPDPGWVCAACKSLGTEVPDGPECPCCGEQAVRPLDIKEAMLRLAAQSGCPVEVVEECGELQALGGVGCLLRSGLNVKQASAAAKQDLRVA